MDTLARKQPDFPLFHLGSENKDSSLLYGCKKALVISAVEGFTLQHLNNGLRGYLVEA